MKVKKKPALKEFLQEEQNTPREKEEGSFKAQPTQASQQIFLQADSLEQQITEREKKSKKTAYSLKQSPPAQLQSGKEEDSQPELKKKKSKKKNPLKASAIRSSLDQLKEKPSDDLKPVKNQEIRDNPLKLVQTQRLQMMSKRDTYTEGTQNSPLQIQLIQSESLKISQEKINNLEEELLSLREKNKSLLSAADLLKEQNQELKIKIEESEKKTGEDKVDFEHEKEILMSALASAKEENDKLKKEKRELDSKLSNYSYSLSHRESSLEGRVEILKMENSVLQREKDKKIIELRKSVEKHKRNLEAVQKQNQDLRDLNEELQKSSHRAVSALRATIFNLEGVDQNENLSTQSKNRKDVNSKKTS